MDKDLTGPDEKPSKTLPGAVEKIIKSHDLAEPEKAQIVIQGAEELYREVRIGNTLKDANGEEVALKEGANVDVTISADAKNTIKKSE
jgi:predicted DNA-binding antitoxin AbrB/MazE fold protein